MTAISHKHIHSTLNFSQCIYGYFQSFDDSENSPYLDLPVVQTLCRLLKLHSHGEVDLIVPKGAQGLSFKLVPILDDHFCLMQVASDLSGGEVDVCKA